MHYICNRCGAKESIESINYKCDCGGLWTLSYDRKTFDRNKIDQKEWNLFRYEKFLPVRKEITLGEGFSPIIPLDDNVLLKMDYFMPTLSFKDRGASVLINHLKAIGVTSVVEDSSGNAGNSIAAFSAKAGIDCEIYVPENTSEKKIAMIKSHGAKVIVVPGTRDHCADICRAQVEKDNKFYASHVYNPFFFEGTKTYIYEVYEQLGRIPKNLLIPLGNGTLFIGILKGLEEFLNNNLIDEMPSIYAVQSENCAPFKAAQEQQLDTIPTITIKDTLAKGIAIGEPMRAEEILNYINQYDITVITAPEALILKARDQLAQQGIYCEHTSAATYAAYLSYAKKNDKLKECLIPMCGAGLKSDQ
jgi:threonine synthase